MGDHLWVNKPMKYVMSYPRRLSLPPLVGWEMSIGSDAV